MTKAFARWLRGWVGAAIAGAAASVSTGLSVLVLDPTTFNFNNGVDNLLKAVAFSAACQAAVGAALYLQKAPLPPEED